MIRCFVALVLGLVVPAPALAEVIDASDQGFTSRTVLEISATPTRVYEALTGEIDQWWDPGHTWSGDAGNLWLEARAGGVFGERLAGGGTVRHLVVLCAEPGKLLRMGGGLGPLQGMAVRGALSIELAPLEIDATTLTLTYAVGGYAAGGLASLAGPVDGVLAEQMARLADHLAQ